ncbi:DNA polymerase III subunit gamma/tau [Microbulbifer sp. OS29]|uniref:DNA polymerase III subunit gamma/tau n=1 Tax=Microbulbifer okhotskensis TaxID=2926617 RepID=A0A9X2EL37_9GAMM|nr:DNA polymerase III subunit gamma/tau [Microbulbifer okhotskensis]MCO1333624.1 DNA polymerase III subunit gamma/tau [Microbulbifer okhotskensis]
MSYQVLARKWRPRLFREMVGQEHVLQALINALDNERLHHAYLFAGTRGVGKTTIARILAKCLNCEEGVSSEPCGQCHACNEIADGRFVDLIEVDAASRTKVEDTRELLENVQYAPTRGRYKVYLIDEVHMLSNSSFNALLKTLEEPPPHVKFLLATTDPQKLPVTVLSRCLQFKLKNMSPERVVGHLKFVLEQEQVPFEDGALWHLARAADGSMRDGMSLTDQAIAFGGGKITEAEVRGMLGSIDSRLVWKLLQALSDEDAPGLFAVVAELSQQAPDYSAALVELADNLHRIAVAQLLPQSIDNSLGDGEKLRALAERLGPENVQLYYQMALHARRDLPLAPDQRSGFEMALLRMLAFRPQGVADIPRAPLPAAESKGVDALPCEQQPSMSNSEVSPAKKPEAVQPPARSVATGLERVPHKQVSKSSGYDRVVGSEVESPQQTVPETGIGESMIEFEQEPAPSAPLLQNEREARQEQRPQRQDVLAELRQRVAEVESMPVEVTAVASKEPAAKIYNQELPKAQLEALTPGSWPVMYRQLGITGILHSIAQHLEMVGRQDNILSFTLDESYSSLYDEIHQRRLGDLFGDFFQQPVVAQIQVGQVHGSTPARLVAATRQERLEAAHDALLADPLVQELQAELSAELVPDSVESLVDAD